MDYQEATEKPPVVPLGKGDKDVEKGRGLLWEIRIKINPTVPSLSHYQLVVPCSCPPYQGGPQGVLFRATKTPSNSVLERGPWQGGERQDQSWDSRINLNPNPNRNPLNTKRSK